MINYNYELDFKIDNESAYDLWISKVIISEGFTLGELNYIFCSDDYLLAVNQQYLKHDYYTDIITFDYVDNGIISGDLFISIDRIRDNADQLDVNFPQELKRVMIHGVLHLCGYGDKTEKEESLMRELENNKINMFHVEP